MKIQDRIDKRVSELFLDTPFQRDTATKEVVLAIYKIAEKQIDAELDIEEQMNKVMADAKKGLFIDSIPNQMQSITPLITVRDYFAGQALAGAYSTLGTKSKLLVRRSFEIADKMIEESIKIIK